VAECTFTVMSPIDAVPPVAFAVALPLSLVSDGGNGGSDSFLLDASLLSILLE
jgi:hypothetical protein